MPQDIDDEDIREFLIESNENLANLDREIVKLEQDPESKTLISSIFRTIHTIKGTCGFFGYERLGSIAHITENILSQVREGQRSMTPSLISLVLDAVDKIKALLLSIETIGNEGPDDTVELRARLEKSYRSCGLEEDAGTDEAAVSSAAPAAAELASGVSQAAEPVPAEAMAAPLAVEFRADPEMSALLDASDAHEEVRPAALSAASSNAAAAPSEGVARDAQLVDSTIRVDVGLLDKLMNLVGELVLARNQLLQDTTTQNATLQKTSQRLNLITSELQEGVMKTRMQPIGVVWNKLPRVVRDLASKCAKKVQMEMMGAGTELDKTIIEAIKDPLTHIVRNSCDHGIELPETRRAAGKNPEGLLLLRAYHEGGVVNIEISDDGAGIDPAKLKKKAIEKGLIHGEQATQMSDRDARHLIFMPGFSTAAQVTSISGRGVGMDVVKTNIEKIGGSVEVLQREPYGTTIRIKIPLTLAIIPGLVVSLESDLPVAGSSSGTGWTRKQRFVVPQANLLELVRLEGAQDMELIKNLHGTPIFHHRSKLLPLVYLNRILGRPVSSKRQEVVNIVVLQAENCQMGLVVDEIRDTQEIVVKPLGRQLKGLTCYVGATIMGDGRPALILDVAGLARLAGLSGQGRQTVQSNLQEVSAQTASQTQMLLLFRAGSFERLAVPLSLVARLEEIETAKIERAAGRTVLHYRGDILSLVSLSSLLDPGRPDTSLSHETAQVIVFTDGSRHIGVVVDQILDIVNESLTVKRSSSTRGLLGSALIEEKITDLLDLHALVEEIGENWLEESNVSGKRSKVLLLEPSATAREMLAEYLGASGYDVLAVSTVSEALPRLRQTAVDLAIAATSAHSGGGLELLKAMRLDSGLQHIPVLALVEHPDRMGQSEGGFVFDAYLVRSQRGRLLDTVAKLVRESALVEVAA